MFFYSIEEFWRLASGSEYWHFLHDEHLLYHKYVSSRLNENGLGGHFLKNLMNGEEDVALHTAPGWSGLWSSAASLGLCSRRCCAAFAHIPAWTPGCRHISSLWWRQKATRSFAAQSTGNRLSGCINYKWKSSSDVINTKVRQMFIPGLHLKPIHLMKRSLSLCCLTQCFLPDPPRWAPPAWASVPASSSSPWTERSRSHSPQPQTGHTQWAAAARKTPSSPRWCVLPTSAERRRRWSRQKSDEPNSNVAPRP